MTTIDFILEKTKERDRFELELSDTFDVKASIVLLILTFLGTISATILTADRLAQMAKLAQFPVIAGVVISGIFCVACLWPKVYLLDDLPETYSKSLPGLGQPQSRPKRNQELGPQSRVLVHVGRSSFRACRYRLYSVRYPPFLKG